jgi:hypothetical protein
MTLTAGTHGVVLTPPVGIPLSGFVGRGPATDVHDDLSATALVLAGGSRGTGPGDPRFAIVALDLIGLYSEGLVAALKDSITAATGIPGEQVFLACSHTHYGPVVAESGDMPGGHSAQAAAYRARLAVAVAECVSAADAARVPVSVSAGGETIRLGVNRRLPTPDGKIALAPNPDGHVDPDLSIVRFDAVAPQSPVPQERPASDVTTVATVVSYACHPSSLESSVRSISADFPGVLRAELERRIGGRALFLQGAAGDIDPPDKRPDWSRLARIGATLADAAVRASTGSRPVRSTPVLSRRARVAVPRRGAASVEAAEADLASWEDALAASDRRDAARWWVELKIGEARAVVDALRKGRSPTIDADIAALRIGDVALAFVPAELFSELGVMIKERSPAARTIVVGYTDGALWYVPTRAAFAEGGYEVVDACRVAPGAGEFLVDRVLDLLTELFS